MTTDNVEFVIVKTPKNTRVNAIHGDEEIAYMILDSGGIVRDICVEPHWRRKGIATDLIRFAIKEGLKPKHNPPQQRSLSGAKFAGQIGKKLSDASKASK